MTWRILVSKTTVMETELCFQHAHQKLVRKSGGFTRFHPILSSTQPSCLWDWVSFYSWHPTGWWFATPDSRHSHSILLLHRHAAGQGSHGPAGTPFTLHWLLLPLVVIASGTEGEGCHQHDVAFWFWDKCMGISQDLAAPSKRLSFQSQAHKQTCPPERKTIPKRNKPTLKKSVTKQASPTKTKSD